MGTDGLDPPTFVVRSPRPNVCAPPKPTSVEASVTLMTAPLAMPVIDADSVISLELETDGAPVAVGSGLGEAVAVIVGLGDGDVLMGLVGTRVGFPLPHPASMAVSNSGVT